MADIRWFIQNWDYYFFGNASPQPRSIVLDKSEITFVSVGQTSQLTATIWPASAIDKSVTWNSSDTSVATVDNNWLVTCVSLWNCTITATTSNWLTATCSITQDENPRTYYDFTSMTTATFETLFPNRSYVTMTEWTWIWNNTTWTKWAATRLISTSWVPNKLELFYKGFRGGSAWWVVWVNPTSVTTTSNDRQNLATSWWTYDGSNTSWRVGTNVLYNSSSTYAVAHSEYVWEIDFSNWVWNYYKDWTQIANWVYSSYATLKSNLSGNIYLECCWVWNCKLEKVWYKIS